MNLLKSEMKLSVATSTSKENVNALTYAIFSAISTPEEYAKN